MAELAKPRSMQPYIILRLYIAAGCEKLAQGFFYTAATWPGIEPRIRYASPTLYHYADELEGTQRVRTQAVFLYTLTLTSTFDLSTPKP